MWWSGLLETTIRGMLMCTTPRAGSWDGSTSNLVGLEDWSPSDKLVLLIKDLKAEGKL